MLQIYTSNSNENLVAVAAEIIKVQASDRFLSPELFLVQSHGMAAWLQQELALDLGVAAAIDFVRPATFFWRLANKLFPQFEPDKAFEKPSLRWHINEILPDKLQDPAYESLWSYLVEQRIDKPASDGSVQEYVGSKISSLSESACFEISDLIADLFDAYQNYRPDWIQNWEEGSLQFPENHRLNEQEAWQKDLWQSLYADVDLDKRMHRVNSLASSLSSLKSLSKDQLSLLPDRLFVFGITALPPQWMEAINELSRFCDIHLLVQNPCQLYWGDIETPKQRLVYEKGLVSKGLSEDEGDIFADGGNELLASWGKQGKDYLSLIYQLENLQQFPENLFSEPQEHSALSLLQADLIDMQSGVHTVEPTDRSIRFASCHSPLREVEALHDYLLDLMSRDSSIQQKDIVVMVPEISEYSPYIDATFARPVTTEEGETFSFSYSISDNQSSSDFVEMAALKLLLTADRLRFTSSEVVDLLELESLRSSFGIEESELDQLKVWIKDLHTRWGLSEEHRNDLLSQVDGDDLSISENSNSKARPSMHHWSHFIRSLIAGYMYGDDEIVEMAGGPVLSKGLDNGDEIALLNKAYHFFESLDWVLRELPNKRELPAWCDFLRELVQRFFVSDKLADGFLKLVTLNLDALEEQWFNAGASKAISWSVFSNAFIALIEQERVSQRFLSGRINFCTLMPMRSIPFKVVCILGLNESSYPRPEIKNSFDLMSNSPARRGDRNRREDDHYLFLEAIISAQKYFYLSYVGRNIRDNSERFPSLLFSQLLTYCEDHFSFPSGSDDSPQTSTTIRQAWFWEHRLSGFHQIYFSGPVDNSRPAKSAGFQDFRSFNKDALAIILGAENTIGHGGSISKVSDDQKPLATKQKPPIEEGYASIQLGLFDSSSEGKAVQEKPESDVEVSLDDLCQFIAHPIRYFYQNILDVRFTFLEPPMEEDEPFRLDGINAYKHREGTISALAEYMRLSGEDKSEGTLQQQRSLLNEKFKLSGVMGAHPIDDMELAGLDDDNELIENALNQYSDARSLNLNLPFNRYQLIGELQVFSTNAGVVNLVDICLSKNIGSTFWSFWLRHNILCSLSNEEGERGDKVENATNRNSDIHNPLNKRSHLICRDRDIYINPVDADVARSNILLLLESFATIDEKPPLMLPKTFLAQLTESESQARSTFFGNSSYYLGEKDDEYWRRAVSEGYFESHTDADLAPNAEAQLLGDVLTLDDDIIEVVKR